MKGLQRRMKIILLACLCSQKIDAFGTGLKVNPPRSATLFPSTRQNLGESDFAIPPDRIFPSQAAAEDGEAIFRAVDSSIEKKEERSTKRLLRACMILTFAQFSSNIPTFSAVIPKDVASAAVTASFIRNSRTDRRVSVKQFLAAALVGWQLIPQAIKLVASASTGIAQCANWYVGTLEAFPIVTKACSSAVIGFLGDTCAQQVEERSRVKREGPTASPMKYDRRRGLSMVAEGLFITGPILHVVYDFLDKLVPVAGSALPPSLAALSQVLLDDIFVDALFVATTFIFTGITEGYGKKTLTQFKTDFVPTVKAGWAASLMLMPLEFICFRFLPVSFRVLGMNFVDIVWDGVLSFQVHKNRRGATEAATLEEEGSQEDVATFDTTTEGLSFAM